MHLRCVASFAEIARLSATFAGHLRSSTFALHCIAGSAQLHCLTPRIRQHCLFAICRQYCDAMQAPSLCAFDEQLRHVHTRTLVTQWCCASANTASECTAAQSERNATSCCSHKSCVMFTAIDALSSECVLMSHALQRWTILHGEKICSIRLGRTAACLDDPTSKDADMLTMALLLRGDGSQGNI